MRIGGRTIGLGFYGRIAELHNRLVRARYFRGHGVHSPFVYNIVREVFMRGELLPGDRRLYRALRGAGVPERRAIQLQNVAIHCGYGTFGLNRADAEFCILTRDLPRAETLMSPCEGQDRQMLCRQIVAAHRSTTVDNRGYLLIFNNNLPKQHFRI